jgi:uncharacterized protein (TIGR04551 family)
MTKALSMARLSALGACLLLATAATAQQDPAQTGTAPAPAPKAAAKASSKGTKGAKAAAAKPAPAAAQEAAQPAAEQPKAAESAAPAAASPAPAPAPAAAPAAAAIDPDEFRRQVMEEVRKELQKAREEIKQETAWVEQDSTARVQDSEAVEQLKSRVNLFQPHGYFRWRYEFLNNLDLGRGPDPAGYYLSGVHGYINQAGNHSLSDANIRFRFEPTLAVSEDLQIHAQIDALDNILMGSDPVAEPSLDPFTPLNALSSSRAPETVKVKRLWARVNTQLGELTFGRMGYHWGLGILHNDGAGLDTDFGDTYDRVAFAPREFKGHKVTAMMDILDKGFISTGEQDELGRQLALDTLADGYRLAVQVEHVDTAEDARRKLEAGEWVFNYGLLADYRRQDWDTTGQYQPGFSGLSITDVAPRSAAVQRKARFFQPDVYLSLRRAKLRVDLEVATTFGQIATRGFDQQSADNPAQNQGLTYGEVGAALQASWAMLPADALLLGLEWGGASGDKDVYGFGAKPWRNGSGNTASGGSCTGNSGTREMGHLSDGTTFRPTGCGDIDGPHFSPTHGHVNNFVFNRAFNVDTILFRNIISSVSSAWYLKPSVRYRPTGRKTGGGDETGFELTAALVYSQAWYAENTPGQSLPLGLEANIGISYDTTDKFHMGLQYGLLLPFAGLRNPQGAFAPIDPSVAHAVRAIFAIPF